MSRRFPPLPGNKTSLEPINWGDPGDYRNRGASVPSTDPKYANRDPAFRPQVPASEAKAIATVAPVAKVKPKSASQIAAEEFATRAARVMSSPAAAGKKKAAAQLLGTGASAGVIIAKLAAMEPDGIRERNAIDAIWSRAVAAVNGQRLGLGANATKRDREIDAIWDRAIKAVHAEGARA